MVITRSWDGFSRDIWQFPNRESGKLSLNNCLGPGNAIMFFFIKNEPIPASFWFIFVLFSLQFQYKLKKHRWCAWDSNPGTQDGRRRRNHGAMAATQFFISLFPFLFQLFPSVIFISPFVLSTSPKCYIVSTGLVLTMMILNIKSSL